MDGHPPSGLPTGIKRNDSQQCNRLHHRGGNCLFASCGARKSMLRGTTPKNARQKKSPAWRGFLFCL
ncbi:hypothetical protein SSKA14_30 [Stenotrophomonas sp. SKA14]|nr:hypothetical protein SSKA14_30 [Stenotrophomonas sp. SKA14]